MTQNNKIPGWDTEHSTRQSRIFSNTTVSTIKAVNERGYEVTINMHNDDDQKIQVFIDHEDQTTLGYVSIDELDDFIKEHTTE